MNNPTCLWLNSSRIKAKCLIERVLTCHKHLLSSQEQWGLNHVAQGSNLFCHGCCLLLTEGTRSRHSVVKNKPNIEVKNKHTSQEPIYNPERATSILGLCNGVFTDQFIFRYIVRGTYKYKISKRKTKRY